MKIQFLILFLFTVSLGAFEFEGTTLNNGKPVSNYYIEDLNGDGFKDLLIMNLKSEARDSTTFSIFINSGGKFQKTPTSRFQISRYEVMFDLGDVLSDSKMEFITLSGDSIRIYGLNNNNFHQITGYALKNPLLDVPAFRNSLRFKFIQDIQKKYKTNYLIPSNNEFFLYSVDGNRMKREQTLKTSGIATYYQSRNEMEGKIGEHMRVSISPPYFQISDVDSDGMNDIIFYSGAILSVHLQNKKGFTSKPTYSSFLKLKDAEGKPVVLNNMDREKREFYSLLNISDSNNDGALDVFIKKQDIRESVFDPTSQIQIYYGKLKGNLLSFSEKPDKIIVSEGFQFEIDFIDIDGDGFEDLAIPNMKMGLFKLIKMLVTRSATISVNFYKNKGFFEDMPTVTKDISMSFEFSGDFKTPVFEYDGDFNGDGNKDLLTSPEEGWLGVHYGGGEDFFSEDPDEEFEIELPRNGNRVKVDDFNNDGRSDIIYRYDLQDDRENDKRHLIRIFIQGK